MKDKDKNYNDLNIHERINIKGNAELLYIPYHPDSRKVLGLIMIDRIRKKYPGTFTYCMLLNKNTTCI